jgi:hypothetical protein
MWLLYSETTISEAGISETGIEERATGTNPVALLGLLSRS